MRKPLSPALCVLLTTCNHDPEAYIPHREMAGLSGFSHLVAAVGWYADGDTGWKQAERRPAPCGTGLVSRTLWPTFCPATLVARLQKGREMWKGEVPFCSRTRTCANVLLLS